LKLPTVLLLVEFNTAMALADLMECDSVSVGVRTVGTKLLTVVLRSWSSNVMPWSVVDMGSDPNIP
jgi:hypothetical protein